jgi:hypothetical protein
MMMASMFNAKHENSVPWKEIGHPSCVATCCWSHRLDEPPAEITFSGIERDANEGHAPYVVMVALGVAHATDLRHRILGYAMEFELKDKNVLRRFDHRVYAADVRVYLHLGHDADQGKDREEDGLVVLLVGDRNRVRHLGKEGLERVKHVIQPSLVQVTKHPT